MSEPGDNPLAQAMAAELVQGMTPLLSILAVIAECHRLHPEGWGWGDEAAYFAELLCDVFLSWQRLDKTAAERARGELDPERRRLLDAACQFTVSRTMLGFLRPGQVRDLMLRDYEQAAAVIGAVNNKRPEEG